MKVLVVATVIGPGGGIERYGGRVVDGLLEAGHTPEVFQAGDWRTAGTRVRGLARIAARARHADVIWVLHPRLAIAIAPIAKATRTPMIVATYGFENWGNFPPRFRFGLLAADLITVISKFSAAMIGDLGREAVLLPPSWGVDPAVEDPPAHRDRRSVLVVARLFEPYKGLDVVCELAERFADEPWEFVLAGAGPPERSIAERVASAPNLSIVIDPDDVTMESLFRDAAVLLLPSRASREPGNRWTGGEGFGIVFLEAARAGTPVLAADEGACPETIGLIGNGMVADPTADGFAPALRLLLDDPDAREALGRIGRQRVEQFAPDLMPSRVEDVLRRVLERTGGGDAT
jgi:phosphatidylinositol alpha-1,6-mannosyltransferase